MANLPEAHLSSIIFQSEPQVHLGCDDDLDIDLDEDRIYTATLNHFPVLNDSKKCTESSHVSSVSLPNVAAGREESTCEDMIIKIIEVSQVSDEVKVCYTGDTMTLEKGFQCGLIPASVYVKTSFQDMTTLSTAESLCFSQAEEEDEAREVNELILKCLSRKKSLTSEGDINSGTSSEREIMSRLLGAQGDPGDPIERQEVAEGDVLNGAGGLKVDAAVQCDLMSSSSTLVVLGNQQQFMGLVLPHSGEIQTAPASYESHHQTTSSDSACRLFSNQGKIAAFYIPENSEVVDITTAIQNGWIDIHTAEVLRSVEIPDVFPDFDHLSEKFSSWLTYKKLAIDEWPNDGSEHNVPTPTEAKQLFISYLMMNSYIDPKSAQRVLVLDEQLNKIAEAFLEEPLFYLKTDESLTHLTADVKNRSEHADSETSLHINEEAEELTGTTRRAFEPRDVVSWTSGRITFDENTQHTFEPHNFVSSGSGRITFDEKSNKNDKASIGDPVGDLSAGSDTDIDTTDTATEEENSSKTDQFGKGNTLQMKAEHYASEDHDNSGSLHVSVPHTFFSEETTNISFPSTITDSEFSFISCHQVPPHYKCFQSTSVHADQADFLCSEDSEEGKNERDRAIQLLKAQMEGGGILDVTSGKCYNLQEALRKGLVDEKTVFELRDSQSDDKIGILGDETGTDSVLKQASSSRCHTEQQSFLRSHCSISISESLPLELVKDSDSKNSKYAEGNRVCSLSEVRDLGSVNMNEAENTQLVTSGKAAVMVLDSADEEGNNKEKESANRSTRLGCEAVGNGETMTNKVHLSFPSESGNAPQMISPSLWSQVTAECTNHMEELPLAAEGSDSQILMDSELTGGISSINIASKSQTQCATFTYRSSKDDSTPSGNDFSSAGCDASVRNPTFSRGESGTSDSYCNTLSLETRAEDESGVRSPSGSEPAPSVDYASLGDLVESAVVSVSRGNCNAVKNIAKDGSAIALPQRAESDFSGESEPGGCQREQSSSAPVCERAPQQQSGTTATNAIDHSSRDVKVSVLTHGGAGDAGRLSPQNDDIFTDTEQISASLCQKDQSPSALVCKRPPQQQQSFSSEIPAADSNITTTNAIDHSNCDIDSVLTVKDLLGSTHSGAGDAERLSPERQSNDIFTVDTEQISVSRKDPDNTNVGRNVSCLPSALSDISFGESESRSGEEFRSDPEPEEQRLDMCVSVYPHTVTEFLSESSITPVVSSSVPSVFSNPAKTHVDDQDEIITHQADDRDLEKAQAQDTEGAIALDQNHPRSLDKGGSTSHGLAEISRPDLGFMDLLKQNSPSLGSEDTGKTKLMYREDKESEATEQSDAPNIQLQLLKVFKTVSTSQDLSMLKEVMDTLSSALGCDSQQDRWHTLESIKEESSEGEDEGSGEDDSGAKTRQPSAGGSASSDDCKVEVVKNKVRFISA